MAKYFLRLGDREIEAELQETSEGLRVNIDGTWYVVFLERLGDSPRYVLTLDGRIVEVLVQEEAQSFNVQIAGRTYEVETARAGRIRPQQETEQFVDGKWALRAPLTGVVVEVRVAAGDQVERGDILMVVEAMKMLNELRTRVAGSITAVLVSERDRVEIGTTLVEVSET